jgi:hypothetical protein
MIRFGPVEGEDQLAQILELQRENHRAQVSDAIARSQGFVTVAHDLPTLRAMHAHAPSVVALEGGRVVGYALVMLREARALLPILAPMFVKLDALEHQGRPLREQRYYVMGQICVASSHRGQGVFDGLYREHRTLMSPRFDAVVTEIATRNTRSMRAHARVGFQTWLTYADASDTWAIVGWDWRRGSTSAPRLSADAQGGR